MDDATHSPRDAATRAAEALSRARALRPTLEAAGTKIDELCEAPPNVLEAMYAARMFRLLLPQAYGGEELEPADYIQCVEAVAMGDASVAWCMNQGSGCSMASAYLDPAVARDVFGPRDAVLAWGQQRNSKAVMVDGGYRVTGRWAFVSGGRHATWIGGHCHVVERDGSLRADPDGTVFERTMLLPKSAVRMINEWDVVGLRGTGSDTFVVEDFFVPDNQSLRRDVDAERRQTATLYRFSTNNLYASGFASVALGVARALMDDFIDLARGKTPANTDSRMAENPRIQFEVASADTRLRAARSHLIMTLRDAWDSVKGGQKLSLDHRMRIRTAATHAIHTARGVGDMIWYEAGASAIYKSNPFERRWRDLHTVTQQAQGRSNHFETVGSLMLGGSPSLRFL